MAGEQTRNNLQQSAGKPGVGNDGDGSSVGAIRESGLMRKAEIPSDEILTRTEVAHFLRCSEPHVTALIERDGLPAFRLGKLWRFKRSEVLAWCERRTNAKSER